MTSNPRHPDRPLVNNTVLNHVERRVFEDQAKRLRELARPESDVRPAASAATVSLIGEASPHVILLSELPANQGVIPLTLHLASQLQTSQARTLVTDLAPSASKLAMLSESPRGVLNHISFEEIQQLWSETPNGKSLACGCLPESSGVTLAAQPSGDHPTADQMPRICEQLLRFLRQTPSGGGPQQASKQFQRVFLLSESLGVPLDQACWQAADEIILLCPFPINAEHIGSVLTARLPTVHHRQRIVLLSKRTFTVRDLTLRRKVQRGDSARIRIGDFERDLECITVPSFQTNTRLNQGLASTAKAVIKELGWSPSSIEIRKAS